MSNFRSSVKRWTPFLRESHFEEWLAARLSCIGCTVYRQPVYMASANHIPSGKYTPKLDLYVEIPARLNSLDTDLSVVVELKNADNFKHLREAHRQVAAAMAGNDWRSAPKNGKQYGLGRRPWRALVMTPGQLRPRCFSPALTGEHVEQTCEAAPNGMYQDWSTETQRQVPAWASELWELYDRQLWDHGASLLHHLGGDSFAFQVHISGQIQMVTIRGGRR